MSKISTLFRIIKKKDDLIAPLGANGFFNWMSDEQYLKLLYKATMHKRLNLENPTTFNEKLQWLKIHDHNPEYTGWVDKIEAKKKIAKILGERYVVPTLDQWANAKDISFDNLPEQVVLKCNHDQGSVMIIDDIKSISRDHIIKYYSSRLSRNPYPGTREYPYKYIKPFVFAEKYLEKSIIDYKFYCFNGEPRFLYCGQGLTADHSLKIDFYDTNWKRMPFYRTDYMRLGNIPKPKCLEEMIEISKLLAKDVPFVRIDLFEVDGQVYFSEFTLCPASGFMPFVPEEYDHVVGEWLDLSSFRG